MKSKITVKADAEHAGCYSLVSWALGWLVVVWNGEGIIAVYPGVNTGKLEIAVTAQFGVLEERSLEGVGWRQELLAWLDNPRRAVSLPLVITGTAFQQQVWRELRGIAAGETISYSLLARRVGRPAAGRAVANACAANQLALVIPCHRVIRRDGNLSGYRWGRELKRRLLAREAGLSGLSNSHDDGHRR